MSISEQSPKTISDTEAEASNHLSMMRLALEKAFGEIKQESCVIGPNRDWEPGVRLFFDSDPYVPLEGAAIRPLVAEATTFDLALQELFDLARNGYQPVVIDKPYGGKQVFYPDFNTDYDFISSN